MGWERGGGWTICAVYNDSARNRPLLGRLGEITICTERCSFHDPPLTPTPIHTYILPLLSFGGVAEVSVVHRSETPLHTITASPRMGSDHQTYLIDGLLTHSSTSSKPYNRRFVRVTKSAHTQGKLQSGENKRTRGMDYSSAANKSTDF